MARRRRTLTQDPALRDLLDDAAAQTHAMVAAEAARFELAARWAETHPAPTEEIEKELFDADGVLRMYGDQPLTIAGEGAPQMAEFAADEFAAACGLSTYQGRALIGAAVEAKYRLPKIWARAIAGEVAVWKVRRVTEKTHTLTPAGAAHVDTALHRVVGTCSFAQIQRAIDAAAAEADTEQAEMNRLAEPNALGVAVRFDEAHRHGGRVPVYAILDYPEAVALENTLHTAAAALKEQHPDLCLDERRALALGRLAAPGEASVGREVVVYAHYQPGDLHADRYGRKPHDIVDIEQLGATTMEQIAAWCGQGSATKLTLRPVLDLDTEIHTDGYRPTAEQREQAILTCPTCVFPGCTRRARACDLDHIVEHNRGGPTTSWNLAPLCRLHHRMKTHGFWTYRRLTRTSFEWTAPDGRTYLVDLTHKRRRTR